MSPVFYTAFTPDGGRIISGSADHSLKIWDAVTGSCLTTLTEHQAAITSVAISPDGLWMASSSSDVIYLWSLEAPHAYRILKPKGASRYAVAFSPDSSQVLTAPSSGFDGQLAAWDVKTAKCLRKLKSSGWPYLSVNGIGFPAAGDQFACGSHSHTVLVLDLARGELRRIFAGHTELVTCVTYNRDGTRVASGSRDGTVRLWDVAKYAMNVAQPRNSSWYSDLGANTLDNYSTVFSHHGARALSGINNWTVEVEKTDTWDWACEALDIDADILCTAFSPDDSAILAASVDHGKVALWDTATGSLRAEFAGTCHNSVLFPDWATNERKGHPRPEDGLMWTCVLGYMPHCFGGQSSSMMFSHDSRYVVTGSILPGTKDKDTPMNSPDTSARL
ncbi:uncharacterized protein PHACADRAFT_248461 [Phanerochaete carnosa HHB-10118-sp]|uniref:Uncharacterized protein n=1 Tax=Phanerochaete carnosa (strain HHB-10118-sp) TaxID=650164 RepID=K5WR06_PHACS|nr:uncharacterized protein PHACADRAFT_248461 [Phanerochaete carnosa HHB-10118-sp]EKM61694.1 hypothetical protein PHACADRAFT_248461 [Phanerochaete carnosa HHB-10118-sp]